MVYLAALALAGALTLENVAQRWRAGIAGTLTVQVTPIEGAGQSQAARVDLVVELLRRTPGVAGVEVLGTEAMDRLLAPWLGPDTATLGLPLPELRSVFQIVDFGDEPYSRAYPNNVSD